MSAQAVEPMMVAETAAAIAVTVAGHPRRLALLLQRMDEQGEGPAELSRSIAETAAWLEAHAPAALVVGGTGSAAGCDWYAVVDTAAALLLAGTPVTLAAFGWAA